MTAITQYSFSNNKKITAIYADNNSNHSWIGYAKDSDSICYLKKQGFLNPNQIYYSLLRYVDEIKAIDGDASNIYVAYDDSIYLGEILSASNPLTTASYISKGAIVESPVDVKINGSDLWFLLPGSASGTNAKLLRYNTSGVLQETVDLQQSGESITDALTMTIDANDDIWIATYEDPAKLVRVYELSGGTHAFTIFNDFI